MDLAHLHLDHPRLVPDAEIACLPDFLH
jgi:hypothetical protein